MICFLLVGSIYCRLQARDIRLDAQEAMSTCQDCQAVKLDSYEANSKSLMVWIFDLFGISASDWQPPRNEASSTRLAEGIFESPQSITSSDI